MHSAEPERAAVGNLPIGVDLPPVGLVELLSPVRLGEDTFRSAVLYDDPQALYGGQPMAQALVAAGWTVPAGRRPHAVRAAFGRRGDSSQAVEYTVVRERDGARFSDRRVVATQNGRTILTVSASFTVVDDDQPDETVAVMPEIGPPRGCRPALRLVGFDECAPPEHLPVHAPHPRRFWLRYAERPPADPLLQAALITYISDRSIGHGVLPSVAKVALPTLNHTVWLHRPTDSPDFLFALDTATVAGGTGLYHGQIWSATGRLLASLAQETLYRYAT